MTAQADPSDLWHMKSALNLARQGLGQTGINPTVGCVLVQNERIVGRGRTADSGRPHAEAGALAQAGIAAKGATAYVTLEPCAHEGETPSCANLLIEAGIARCVIALLDCDPRTHGQGMERMKQAGIQVHHGIMEQEAYALNKGFFLRHLKQRPYITLKVATTLDGKIASVDGHSKWITNALARQRAHLIRSQHDTIAIGAGTLQKDNPTLSVRLNGFDCSRNKITKIIFDTGHSVKGGEALFEGGQSGPVYVVSPQKPAKPIKGCETLTCDPYDLPSALMRLTEKGVTRLLVEGGSALVSSFLRAGLYDELVWFRAPVLMGGDGLCTMQELGVSTLNTMPSLNLVERIQLDDNVLERYTKKR